jgi:hypothetical protein
VPVVENILKACDVSATIPSIISAELFVPESAGATISDASAKWF